LVATGNLLNSIVTATFVTVFATKQVIRILLIFLSAKIYIRRIDEMIAECRTRESENIEQVTGEEQRSLFNIIL
jgi:hypothetical protein